VNQMTLGKLLDSRRKSKTAMLCVLWVYNRVSCLNIAQPPELLASILSQLEEVSNDLWPPPETTSTDEVDNVRSVAFESLGL